ncbi:MAG: T9SS type A sorting domain-containing protein [bacterium]
MKIINILLISLIIILISDIQAETWSRVYGTSEDDYAISAKQTLDGGYIILGQSGGYSNPKAWLLKIDEYGDTVWSKTFDSICSYTSYYQAMDIEVDYDSGYIMSINLGSGVIYNLRIIKTDQLGDVIWSKTFDINILTRDYPYDLDKTSDSGYIVVGNAMYQNSSSFIIKLYQNGDSLWTTNTVDEGFFTSVCEGRDGSFIATSSDAYPYPPQILFVYDSLGNILSWHGYSNCNTAYDIEKLNDSNYLIGASTYLFKIDENLDTIWSRDIGALDVEPSIDGGFVTTYFLNSDAYLNKYTSDGNSVWSVSFGGPGGDKFYSVSRTEDGGYICCGHTNSWGNGGYDYYIVKTDSLGYAMGVEEEFFQQYPEYPNISIENLSSGQVKISFIQSHYGDLNFSVYDLSGRMIDQPLEGFQDEGECSIILSDYRPGVYFYQISNGEEEWRGKFQIF